MSYTIEYNRKVFVGKSPADWDNEPCYYLFILQGDNNVYESTPQGGQRRARDWVLVNVGATWQIINEICRRAGSTEGGSLQYVGGRWTTPEKYLARYRKEIQKAKPLERLFEELPLRTASIIFPRKAKTDYIEEKLNEVRQTFKRATNWYEHERYTLSLKTLEDLMIWLKYRPFAYIAGLN